MAHETVKVYEIVERAVEHKWSIPEFQRGFVWKPYQVKDLIESLWFNFPVGSFLVWNSKGHTEARSAYDAQDPSLWVVDGQQRTTALCVLMGRKPYWWPSNDGWNEALKRYDVRFDVDTLAGPFFVVADGPIKRSKSRRYVPVSELLSLDTHQESDQRKLEALAQAVKDEGLCQGRSAMEIYTRLDRICRLRQTDVIVITVDHDLEDVVEIFSRLNSRGTRVTEADIYLGVVSARTPGFVREHFLPFVSILDDAGYEVTPNLLFRSMTGLGAKSVRFKEVPDSFWDGANIQGCWQRARTAWEKLIARFREHGILSTDPMPSAAGLVPLVTMMDKFPDARFNPILYWFLQASRYGRYSSSATTSLNEDLREIKDASSADEALQKLLARIGQTGPLTADDFLRDYGDARFTRFLLYLMLHRNGAKDWDESGHRIGFEGLELLAGFRPQWHHIFPRKYLGELVPEEKVNALANIAVIGSRINIRISKKSPLDYIARYKITQDKLAAQFIEGDVVNVGIDGYPDWLDRRAERLAMEANAFLTGMKGDC